MNTRTQSQTPGRALILALTMLFAGPAGAAENGALAKDLTSTISLLGLPCGQVVNVVTQGNRDYIVTCSDKNRYRVYLNPQGRVAAEKR
ncbi:MAG: hypothetical protein H6R21_2456 [Proteobacteria bacterium]|nr:hypothetical protein [Pseudomonadota bacterium]RPJ48085.1 MAG: hypothetical protein EHM16_03745 [Betaproteobacteria bacterium]